MSNLQKYAFAMTSSGGIYGLILLFALSKKFPDLLPTEFCVFLQRFLEQKIDDNELRQKIQFMNQQLITLEVSDEDAKIMGNVVANMLLLTIIKSGYFNDFSEDSCNKLFKVLNRRADSFLPKLIYTNAKDLAKRIVVSAITSSNANAVKRALDADEAESDCTSTKKRAFDDANSGCAESPAL